MAGNVDIREPVKSITRLAGRFFTEGTASWNMVNGAHQVHLDNQMLDDLAIDPDLLRLANTKTLFDLY